MSELKYILYARKSTESKDRQALSISEQIEECNAVVTAQGLNVISIESEAKSAYKPNKREVFSEVLERLKAGEADALLVWKPSRLTRNPEEGGALMQLLQDGVIKEIRTATNEVYTSESDHLVLTLQFGMSNEYSRNISKDVKRAMKYKVERGEYPRQAPIGYENYGEIRGQRNIRPHEIEAPLVTEAFKLASTGQYSFGKVAEYLYENGIRTKNGTRLAIQTLSNILKNPMYYGFFKYNEVLYEGTYEPIIDKTLFDKVQNSLGIRSKPKVTTWNHTYNGLMLCGNCECSISTSIKKKFNKSENCTRLYTFHRCTWKRDDCKQPPISKKYLEENFVNIVSAIEIGETEWNLSMDLLKAKGSVSKQADSKKVAQYKTKITALIEQKSGLVKMRAGGELTEEEFMYEKQLVLSKESEWKGLLQKATNGSKNWLEQSIEFFNTAYEAKNVILGEDYDAKRKLLIKVGSNYTLLDKNLTMTMNKPYDVLANETMRLNWQG